MESESEHEKPLDRFHRKPSELVKDLKIEY